MNHTNLIKLILAPMKLILAPFDGKLYFWKFFFAVNIAITEYRFSNLGTTFQDIKTTHSTLLQSKVVLLDGMRIKSVGQKYIYLTLDNITVGSLKW